MSDYRWPSTVTEFCVRSIVNDPQRFINVLVRYVVVLDSELKQERPIWTIHEERDVGSNWSCWRALCLGSIYNMWKWWISYSGSSYLWVKNILVEHVYAIHSDSISYLTTIWLYVCRIWISNLLFSHTGIILCNFWPILEKSSIKPLTRNHSYLVWRVPRGSSF